MTSDRQGFAARISGAIASATITIVLLVTVVDSLTAALVI